MKYQTKFTLAEASNILEGFKMGYEHKILTVFGVFSFEWVGRPFTTEKQTKKDKKGWWIAGKFSDPDEAKIVYNCNQHSGKYNFHGSVNHKGFTIMTPLEELINFLAGLKENNKLIK